ncbi:MAG: cell division protein FtsL [Spirochaetes bacterium]|nr:cell division protein FtsL [Spirochaetota bacterium]
MKMSIKRLALFYAIAITIPFFLGLNVWQAKRYANLHNETRRLEAVQADIIRQNQMLMADIAFYSSAPRIESVAANELNLVRIQPEDIMQIVIEGDSPHGN